MTGNDNRASPKRYGLLKGQIQVADDFDAPLELAEFGMANTPEVDISPPNKSSALSPDDRAQVERDRLSDDLLKIAGRCAATAVKDARTADEIIGYDEHGAPVDSTKPKDGVGPSE